MKGAIKLHRVQVNGSRQYYAECPRHRRPLKLHGWADLGTHNGVMSQAARHRREHALADAKKAAKAAQ